jgi:heat shock protein HslJ
MNQKYLPLMLIVILGIGSLLAGCTQAATPTQGVTIQGVVWQWFDMTKQSTGAVTKVPSPGNYTIIFYEDGTLEGKADCNNFTGTYTEENGLKITIGSSTMAACGGASLDQQYLTLLGGVTASSPYGGGGLALSTGGGDISMTFKNGGAAPAQANPIQNINWQWTDVTNKTTGEVTTVQNPENYTIVFNADGSLDGKADCNTFNGTYSQSNGFSIKIGTSTKAYCGDTSLDQQYLDLLANVAAGGPDGSGGLALETAGGEQRMQFKDGGPATK